MRKLWIPIVAAAMVASPVAMVILPAAANAAQCRDTASGKFAKCGAPGAVPASEYVAKTKTSAKTAHVKAAPKAAATPDAKPGPMAIAKPKAKATPAPAATAVARCKTTKGKFAKCGTPGAVPA